MEIKKDSEIQKIKSHLDVTHIKYISENIRNLLGIYVINDMECFEKNKTYINKEEYFRVILYIRLSVEDGDIIDGDVSKSIKNQLLILLDECEKRKWIVVAIFCEEGISGVNDERPEWKKSLKFCENGNTEIVLCKSQSRFSRNMEMIEKYLHNEFINWNIRFVGLVDSTDTLIVGNKKTRQINGLVNEWQVEDQSINIRAILKNKQSNGLFTGSFAPYGYLKDPKDKYHLIIDEESAEIVREIFKKYANGQGATHICAYLNQKKIPIPSIYKYQKYQKYNCSKIDYNKISSGEYIWRTNTIYNILKNEVYIGTLIQHKNEGISYKNRKQRRVPKDKRIVVPHCHKAIIDKEIWNIVSKRFSKYKERIKSCDGGKINLFSGKIRCNCCGHIFYRDSKKIKEKEYAYWVCGNKYETAKVLCDNKAINEKDIYEIVINSINNQIEKYYDKTIIEEKYFKQRTPNKDKKKELLNEKEKLEKNINKSKNVITLLYEDRVNKIINEEEFLKLKNRTEANMNISKERIKQIEKKLKIDKNEKIELEDIIRKHTKIKKLDRFIIDEFVHQINIGEYDPKTNTRQIIIEWNFGINCSTT